MVVKVLIPSALRQFADKTDSIELDGKNVGEVLKNLSKKFPLLEKHMFKEDGTLRSFVNIFLNGENIREIGGNNAVVKNNDTIMIVPSIAGGKK